MRLEDRAQIDRDRHHTIEIVRKTFNQITMAGEAVTVSGRRIQIHGTYAFGSELSMYNDTDGLWIDKWRWRWS